MFKNQKGITLVALVVTIIVLLILAAVTINLIVGDNGLINRTQTAANKYKEEENRENNEITNVLHYLNGLTY